MTIFKELAIYIGVDALIFFGVFFYYAAKYPDIPYYVNRAAADLKILIAIWTVIFVVVALWNA